MARRWVANASPLILLRKIAQIQLLSNLAQALVIPAGVATEVDTGPETDPARQWISGPGRTFVRETGPVEPVIVAWDLSLTLRLPARGTLGVLLLARKEGHLVDLDAVLGQVQEAGLHIAPEILEALRRLA